jgi:hypothetical protein
MSTLLRSASALVNLHTLDQWRIPGPGGALGDAGCGAFEFTSPFGGVPLRVIASNGMDWDHVSVSTSRRCPTWIEMEWVRDKFFQPWATVVQYSVPRIQHVNVHPYCLHLWRPHRFPNLPLPPVGMV